MILCCGEALIDMLPGRTEAGQAAFVPHAGGAVFNTSIALGRLGVPAGLFCGLSTDIFGGQLADALDASGVDRSLCPVSDRPTTLAFVTLTDGQARYAFNDENTAARMVTPEMLPALPGHVGALFFGGISLVAEPCGSALETLCLREAARLPVMLDPNIRPAFIRDEPAYRARLARMIALADIVKLSEEDAAWLTQGDPETAAPHLLRAGAGTVLITRGARGASAFWPDGNLSVPAPPVVPVDTVGAGDAFNGGFLAALARSGGLSKAAIRGLDAALLQSCLAHSLTVAAISTTRAGANPPWADEVAP